MHAAMHRRGVEIHRVSTEPMDANSGEPWSEMDISDLTHSLDYGDTFAQTARRAISVGSWAATTSLNVLGLVWRRGV
jgi:hypothetical protein